jgi:hypothetical protein
MVIKKLNIFLKSNKIKFDFFRLSRKNLKPYNYVSKKVFFFAPEAALHPHFHACCYLGRLLKDDGFDVSIARCWNLFERCIVKQSNRVNCHTPYEKIFEICYSCAKNSIAVQRAYNLNFLNLESYNIGETKNKIDNEHYLIEEMIKKEKLAKYSFQRIPFGTLCEYEIQLANKSQNLNYENTNLINDWASLLKSAIKTHLILKNLFFVEQIKNLVYFNDYVINLSARFAMDANDGQSTMVTHAYNCGIDRSKIVFFKEISFKKIFNDCIQWKNCKSRPLSKENIIKIADDAIARFCGKSVHTYSPPFEPFQQNIITNNKKTIVIFTSSPDESACFKVTSALKIDIPPQIFTFGKSFKDCQKIWLLELQRYAKKNQNINFIVRIHPREGSNKREKGESEHLQILKACLKHPPSNFTIFWPENNVSSYTIGLCADLVLTSWSTIGIEMARLGIPVLTCTKGTAGFPVENFICFEKNKNTYLKNIKFYLSQKYSFAKIRDAFRWWFYSYLSSSINISDVVPSFSFSELVEFKKTKQAEHIKKSIFSNYDVRNQYYKKILVNEKNKIKIEHKALVSSIKRFILFFAFGENQKRQTKILFFKNKTNFNNLIKIKKKYLKQKKFILYASSRKVSIFDGTKTLELHSPCLAKLSRLISTNKIYENKKYY